MLCYAEILPRFRRRLNISETEKETKTLRLLLKAFDDNEEVLALIDRRFENNESMYVCKTCLRKLAKVSGIWEQIASGLSVTNEKIKKSESTDDCQDTRKRLASTSFW